MVREQRRMSPRQATVMMGALLLACTSPPPEGDAAVYAVALPAIKDASGFPKAARLVDRATLAIPPGHFDPRVVEHATEELGIDGQALQAAVAASARSVSINAPLPAPMRFFDSAAIRAKAPPKDPHFSAWWDAFEDRYPDDPVYLSVSGVGYHGERAVLIVRMNCSFLCSRELVVQLANSAGRWRVTATGVLSQS